MSTGIWERLKGARLVRVILVYLAASWIVLQVTGALRDALKLPEWVSPVALILLLAGLVVVLATAWVQSHPLTPHREAAGEVPESHELDLGGLKDAVTSGQLPHLTWGRAAMGGVFAFALLFGIAGLYVLVKDRGRSFAPSEAVAEASAAPGVAVLPFSVRGAELEVWREGMVDLLSTALDGAAGLRGIDSRTVLAGWSERVPGEKEADLATGLDIARDTGARYAIMGTAVAIGPNVRLVADVFEVEDGSRLGQGMVEGAPDSVLALTDRLAVEVLRILLERPDSDLPRIDLASVTTTSFPALKSYLEAEAFFRRADLEPAIRAYERAVEIDSTFARAWYRIGDAYSWWETIASERSTEAYERASRLADRLPERERILVHANLALSRSMLDGLESLRAAVKKYPDDAEAWYLLGDTYMHLRSALGTSEDAERAFERAAVLDPGFAPYRIHLIDLAFEHSDKALAARRVEEYSRLAPGSEENRQARFGLAFVFGNPAERAIARGAIDTVDMDVLYQLGSSTLNALNWPQREAFLQATLRRPDDEERPSRSVRRLFYGYLVNAGRRSEALEYLDDPRLPNEAGTCGPYEFETYGVDMEPEVLDRTVGDTPVDSAGVLEAVCIGAYAADRANWVAHAQAVTYLRERSSTLLAEADTVGARVADAGRDALEGYALWKRGQLEQALVSLQRSQPDMAAEADFLDERGLIRWWVGEILLELDRPREAERYFRSFWHHPLATLQLGAIYDELGEREKAREAYEYFAAAWRDADPELQPLVHAARQAAAGRGGLRRE